MGNKKRNHLGRTLSHAIIIKFFAALAVYITALILAMTAAGIFLRWFTWEHGDPLYHFFKLIDHNSLAIIVLCSLVGFSVIFVHYWRKTLSFISAVVAASEVLVAPGDEIIQLPDELKSVEIRMNQAKRDMLRNAALAKEAEQRKNDLVMYLAHDIKTPLTSVMGYLSLLDEAADIPAAQQAKYVRIALEKAYRLEQLIDEFFEITRYNLQNITLSAQTIDLYYMLAQMTDEFYPQFAAHGKRAHMQVPEDLTLYGDPDKLARVFNNVLKNAVAHSPDHSVIDITAQASGDWVTIAFTNAGTIPKDKLVSIFDKFYRLDSARSSDTGGAGLGLAIAKEIVALHGGRIYADSENEQTTFTIALPAVLEAPHHKTSL